VHVRRGVDETDGDGADEKSQHERAELQRDGGEVVDDEHLEPVPLDVGEEGASGIAERVASER